MKMTSYSAKRSFSHLQDTKMRCPKELLEDDDGPIKKKLKKNLIEIFNRASMCVNAAEDHMNVFLRIKPFTPNDSVEENQNCFRVDEVEQSVTASAPDQSHTQKSVKRGLGKSERKFTFSRIFNENTTQADFFNETMLGMTKDFISGQNSLVFTYGVTSSGKTFTIQGKPQDAGILPRSLDVLFNSVGGKQIDGIKFKPRRFTDVVKLSQEEESSEYKLKEKILKMSSDDDHTVSVLLGDDTEQLSCTMASCSSASQDESLPDIESRIREELKVDVDDNGKFNFAVWISFAEIYNEQIFDLLEQIPSKKSTKRPTLKIADDQSGRPYIKGLNEIHVGSADEAYRLLTIGKRNLQTASTRLNHCSSRSHCIFTIKVIRVVVKDDPNIARVSMLSFCDLAGSERYSKTQATGDRLKEAGNINTSLLTLGRCIEILRYNQVHRDSVKVVPFRDSKLTRLFTNFFNGSGRAAMIVNVSQCASMFDETLQVFKFSAIAKQVKYIQKPVEPPKPKKKTAAPLPRPSIPWEAESSKMLLEDASNEPLPLDDSEEDSSLDDSMDVECIVSNKTPEELIQTVKFLLDKNAQLMESLEVEMINASNAEIRVRREVQETMKKQQVLIEKEYSKMLEESEEDAREAMDERVQNIIDCYEKKLERIQRKVDDDDEWVSSLLFFQEERKVQERDEKIAELEKTLKETELSKRENHTEKDEKIEQLEEYIADLRSFHHSREKEKDEKIEEFESYIQEAGDVYKINMEQIAKLRQEAVTFALETKTKEERLAKMEKENIQLEQLNKQNLTDIEDFKKEASAKSEEAGSKITELHSQLNEMESKLKNKDSTIKTLEEECEQMQGEIERLQDQMSQMGDMSKRSDFESSVAVEEKSDLTYCDTSIQTDLLDIEEVEIMRERNGELLTEKEALASQVGSLEEQCEVCTNEKSSLKQRLEEVENECRNLNEINENLNQEILVLQKEAKSLAAREVCTPSRSSAQSTMITDMVKEMEIKSTPCNKLSASQDSVADSEDEIIFNCKSQPVLEQYEQSGNQSSVNSSAIQLKDAELTINALRNKLQTEEEDFFKREQALIHGYTAEIDNLKLELVKLKKSSLGKSQEITQDESLKSTSLLSSHGDMDVCATNDAGSDKKCSEKVLSSEVTSLQEQLVSCREAYRQLQCQIRENVTSVPETVEGNRGKLRHSTQNVVCRDMSITDSVLQFEMTEYVVELDMWKNKVEDLSQKIGDKESSLLEARHQIENLHKELKLKEDEKAAIESELASESSKIVCYENELKALRTNNESILLSASKRDSDLEELNTKLQETLSSNAEMKGTIDQLKGQVKRIEEEITTKSKTIEEKDTAIHSAESKISNLKREIVLMEESQAKMSEHYESKSKDNGGILKDTQKELQNVLTVNSRLTVEKERLEKDVKVLEDKLDLLSAKVEGYENDSSSKDKKLLETQFQLEKEKESKAQMIETLEKMKQDHQQESAEVSQKLILLEKEKRMAERKLNEMKGKEQEWQMKYQAQDRMKELEIQLQTQLKTTRESLKKHSSKNSELSDELAQQRTENVRLEKEMDQLNNELENRQSCFSKMEEEITTLKQEATLTQKKNEELMASLNDVKTGLQNSDEMTEHQEKIIQAQDEDISILNSKLEELDSEKQRLSKEVLEKEKEMTALKQHLSEELLEKETEMTALQEKFQSQKESDSVCDELSKEISNLKEKISKNTEILAAKDKDINDLTTKINSKDKDLTNLKTQLSTQDTGLVDLKAEMNTKDKDKAELTAQLNALKQNLKQCEKDLAKQQSINRRNKEEMEDWQKEKDACLSNFEDILEKSSQEKADLTQENEKLRKDNSDLVKQVTNSQCAKDKVIADLRKNNNTLSIELASVQGVSPPPKFDTPDRSFPNRIEFTEDVTDIAGHLEIDATPPAALKKGKKRNGSKRNTLPVVADDIYTPTRKSLKTIEETNEQSSCSSDDAKKPLSSIASDLANEVFASLSPLTRSGRQGRQKQKNPPVTGLSSIQLQDENSLPLSTRRSSRLRTRSSSKHSVI